MNIFYVYQLRLEGSEEPFYIGKGKGNRIEMHFRASSLKSHNSKNSTIKGANRDGISIHKEKLHENLSDEVACEIERGMIAKYGRKDQGNGPLCNHTDGGEGISGYIYTDELRAQRSKIWTGRSHSEESKLLMAERAKGRKHSAETLAKFSEQRKGRKKSDEEAKAISVRINSNPRICPHCKKSIKGPIYFRHHGDKCKSIILCV